jgi:hypothetical protein
MSSSSAVTTFVAVAVAAGVAFTAACGQEARAPGPPVASGSGSAPATLPVAPPAAPPAAAPAGDITLQASVVRSVLELTLRNDGAAPATIATHITGGALASIDWLTLELEGPGGRRVLRFIDERDESVIVTAALAPGATTTVRADLVRWAIDDGRPLEPGHYNANLTCDASKETQGKRFVAVATTDLDIEAPGGECAKVGYKAPAGAALVLLGYQAATGRATAHVGLYNPGAVAVCVYSHVETHEVQNDWLTVLYADGGKYHHYSRVIHLDDARDKSYPASVLLGPGQTIWHTIDVDAWARRERNGAEPLPAGSLYTQARYDTSKETRVWAGRLVSASFELRVK